MTIEEQEIKMDDIIAVFKRQRKIILLPALIAAIGVAVVTHLMPKTYESYALLRIGYEGNRQLETIASLREIMQTKTMIDKISQSSNEGSTSVPLKMKYSIEYNDAAGLLKIAARANKPELAQKFALTATNMVSGRHQALHQEAQEKMKTLIAVVKDILKPVPLSSGLTELRIEPTRVEIMPVINNIPISSNYFKKALASFFAISLLCTFIAFYIDGKRGQQT